MKQFYFEVLQHFFLNKFSRFFDKLNFFDQFDFF